MTMVGDIGIGSYLSLFKIDLISCVIDSLLEEVILLLSNIC
jgi:hypothetical protein